MYRSNYTFGVVIGRFMLPHFGHFHLFNEALKKCDHLIIVLGSANNPRTPKDPFTETEREKMIMSSLKVPDGKVVSFKWVEDEIYSDTVWAAKVQFAVDEHVLQDTFRICLFGYNKDESSFYLKMFPQWDYVQVDPLLINGEVLSATPIREALYELPFKEFCKESTYILPGGVIRYLEDKVVKTESFSKVCEWYKFLKTYKSQFKDYPYPPVFVTSDAVVMQSGHVLMIQRKSEPGKGLWALPGGFLNQNETLQQCMLRELSEETRIKVPGKILERSIKDKKEFDHPNRSLRGRTITMAYYIELEDVGSLPKVKGADDAAVAQWFPLSSVLRMRSHIFEDHLDIIRYFLGYI